MHSKLKRVAGAAHVLERLIDALAEDLAEASDEEVLQACADLGMNPEMRGSAAFIGLKGPSVSWRDFFDVQEQLLALPGAELQQVQAAIAHRAPTALKRRGRARRGRPETAKADEEDAGEK